MGWILNGEIWIALLTLTAFEVVLGIDNIRLISILASKLPRARQPDARRVGLALALLTRIALLWALIWAIQVRAPLFTVLGHLFTARDLILLLGGAFLIARSTYDIHEKLEGAERQMSVAAHPSVRAVVVHIVLLDVVFALEAVITAVGMVQQIPVMIGVVMIAIVLMILFAGPVSDFVGRHPTLRMLASSFLLLMGTALIADGVGLHIPRGYIYFALGCSVLVEWVNSRLSKPAGAPPALREPHIRR